MGSLASKTSSGGRPGWSPSDRKFVILPNLKIISEYYLVILNRSKAVYKTVFSRFLFTNIC